MKFSCAPSIAYRIMKDYYTKCVWYRNRSGPNYGYERELEYWKNVYKENGGKRDISKFSFNW